MRRIVMVVVLVVAAVAAAAIGARLFWPNRDKASAYLTAPLKRGDLVASISATGTIEPEAAVDIGAQVAGVIIAFGTDKHGYAVTWGSMVEAGDVLARIDGSLYAAAVATAKAQLSQGEANVLAAEANVLQRKANLLYATQNWGRAQKLGPSDALAQSAYDQYQAVGRGLPSGVSPRSLLGASCRRMGCPDFPFSDEFAVILQILIKHKKLLSPDGDDHESVILCRTHDLKNFSSLDIDCGMVIVP